jgi:hypothetical protein
LQLALGASRKAATQESLAELMKKACGIMKSGAPDLGSNPDHLKNFGGKTRDR